MFLLTEYYGWAVIQADLINFYLIDQIYTCAMPNPIKVGSV